MTDAQPERDVSVAILRSKCTQRDGAQTCADLYLPEEHCLYCRAADDLAALREQLRYAEMTLAQCGCDESNVTMSFDEFRGMENELAELRGLEGHFDLIKSERDNLLGEVAALRAENVRARRWRDYARRVRRQRERFRAKCERLADMLLIRTRELEDRTAERDEALHEISGYWRPESQRAGQLLEGLRGDIERAEAELKDRTAERNRLRDVVADQLDGCIVTEIREGERDGTN